MADPTDELYAAPLEGFIKARDALAKSIAESGDADGAKAVRSLRKPSLAAWAINQLARRRAKLIADLLEATDELEAAQRSGNDIRSPGRRRNEAITQAVAAAAEILVEGGHAAAATTLEKVRQSLYSAPLNGDDRAALAAGTLSRETEPSGFGFGLVPDEAALAEAPEPSRRALRKAEDLADRATDAERFAADAERRADAAERDAEGAKKRAQLARRAARDARAKADRLRAEADAAAADAGL
jgi:hypothetical protein